MGTQHCFSQTFSLQKVDETNGVIHGVGMITVGPVIGHEDFTTGQPLCVDELTIQQVLAAAQQYRTGLKVKADHGSGVMDVIGYLNDYFIDTSGPSPVLRADLHVLDSEPNKAKIFEMANTMPDCFGLSVSFTGEDEIVGGQICTRCEEIFSCDLVTEPAACPTGLFERRRVDAGIKGSMAIQSSPPAPAAKQAAPAAKSSSDNAPLPTIADMAAAHKQLMEQMKSHLARFAKLEAAVAALAPSTAPGAPLPSGDADKTNEPPNKEGVSGQAAEEEPLPFEAEAEADADAEADAGAPAPAPVAVKKPVKMKMHSVSTAQLREFGMKIAQTVAKDFAAKLGQSAAAPAAPGAPTDHAPKGEKPEDKFIATAQRHFKATGSKTKALSMAAAECGNEAHRAFIASQKRIEFKRE